MTTMFYKVFPYLLLKKESCPRILLPPNIFIRQGNFTDACLLKNRLLTHLDEADMPISLSKSLTASF